MFLTDAENCLLKDQDHADIQVKCSRWSVQQQQTNEVHRWLTLQVEQLVGYSVMTEVDILTISGIPGYTVQRDILTTV